MNKTKAPSSFQVGEIIHHKRYHYRGVVLSWDAECKADKVWYQKNQTQPRRDQCWYHVLVDGGAATYVAEENLEQDKVKSEIHHPLLKRFFASYYGGRYYQESMN